MTVTITTAALWEPRRDSVDENGNRPVGVQLNLDIAEGYTGDAGALFNEFLEAVPTCVLAAYRLNGATLELIASAPAAESSHSLAGEILAWLKAGVEKGGSWTSAVYSPPHGEMFTDRELAFDDDRARPSAGARLGSAQSWAAPIPQMAGLTRLFAVPDGETTLYVVPWFGSEPAAIDRFEDLGDSVVRFVLPTSPRGGWPEVWCEAAPTIALPLDTSSLIAENGFLRTSNEASDVGLLLKQLREQVGTALWAAPQLIGLKWPKGPADAQEAPADNAARVQRRLVWRAATGVAALLDPLLLAMGMADNRRLGPFAARLAAVLAEKHGKSGLADELRTVMGAWNGLGGPIGDEARRNHFFDTSGRLLGRPDWKRADNEVLPDLLEAFKSDSVSWSFAHRQSLCESSPAEIAVKLDAELQTLLTRMGGEDGIEAGFLTNFEEDKPGFDWLTQHFPVETLPEPAHPGQSREDDSKRAAALATIRNAFADGFNGLDAVRHANGAVFAAGIERKSPVAPTVEEFRGRVKAVQWFERRFGLLASDPDSPFTAIIDHLPQIPDSLLADGDARPSFAEADAATAEDLLHRFDMADGRTRRFVADSEPQDIHLQIAVDSDTSDGDLFEQCYDGIGVLVKRDDGEWAHAHLATTVEEPDATLTIVPSRPAVIDGERQLFLTYDGVPFADAAFEDNGDELKPFRSHDAPVEFAGYLMLPALAYGRTYWFAAYAVSRSGVLPLGVADQENFLVPATRPDPPEGEGFTSKHRHSRTTAIGAVTFEQPAGKRQPPIDRIQPLSSDYPRLGLSAGSYSDQWRDGAPFVDLWRGSDGSPLIVMPKKGESPVELTIADLSFTNAQALSLELIADPAWSKPDTEAAVDLPVNGGFARIRLTLTDEVAIAFVDDQTIGVALTIVGKNEKTAVWVRLRLKAEDGKIAMASFADPRGAITGSVAGAAPAPDRLIVLAPDQPDWQAEFPTKTTLLVRFPAMGTEDFDRWLSNTELLESATAGGQPSNVKDFRIEVLDAALQGDAALKERRDAIPDLAVGALQVEVTVLDVLGKQRMIGTTTAAFIDMPTLGALLEKATPAPFVKQLDALRELRKAKLTIASAAEDGNFAIDQATLKVTVPAGVTARLTVRRLVDTKLFEGDAPVIDERLKELAVGTIHYKDVDYLLFDGPACTIETMCAFPNTAAAGEAWYKAAAGWIDVRATETTRKYDLVLAPKKNDSLWRYLGEADVITQRWRFLGHPIHNWFAPKSHAKSTIKGPVVWLSANAPKVTEFENEAFTHSDTQAVSKTVKLKPLGQTSLLRECEWEAPSATMFRHRVRLRGRYAGALCEPSRAEILVVGPPPKPGAAEKECPFDIWVRVVMLADRTRLALTRPQLRALIPLTTSPDSRVAPPLLAMMTEPPFAFGGLADRIASGVATGFGYEMQDNTLGLQGVARGEAGPDPIHSYWPLDPAVALLLGLDGEGPIGLTFDNDSAPAAAYPNSAWLLTPTALSDPGMDWQEHFVSVTLRRYLDPDWLVGEAKLSCDTLDFAETAWITVPAGADQFKVEAAGKPLLSVSHKAFEWTIKVAKPAILSDCAVSEVMDVTVVEFTDPGVETLALLHQPLEPGRAAMSVFAIGRDNDRSVASGAIEAPRLMASFAWRFAVDTQNPAGAAQPATGEPTIPARAQLVFTDYAKVAYISASAPTALEWGRTGRNADRFDTDRGAVGWDDLRLVENGGALAFSKAGEAVWLHPSLRQSPSVLHVHRHLALLPTRIAGGQGRALELFKEPATLLLARNFNGESANRLRVMEFETPARPMGRGGQVPRAFNAASFPLASVCGKDALDAQDAGPVKGALLIVRPVGVSSQAAKSIVLALNGTKIEINRSENAGNLACIVVRAVWEAKLEVATVDAAGTITPPKNGELIHWPEDLIVSLSLPDEPASGEWWADVSMLVLSKVPTVALDKAPLEFEFAWLFGGTSPELETGLDYRSLRTMTEAQARMVRVSPPIAIG